MCNSLEHNGNVWLNGVVLAQWFPMWESATPSTATQPHALQGKQPEDLEPTSIRSPVSAFERSRAKSKSRRRPPHKLTTPVKRIMDFPSPSAAPSEFRDLLHIQDPTSGLWTDFMSCLRLKECKLDIKANTILNSKNHWLFRPRATECLTLSLHCKTRGTVLRKDSGETGP